MRIVDIRQTTIPIKSEMKNAYISFAEMDVSLVAIITDVVRNGRQLVGFGFNSNGRYAQPGILASRMIPRLLQARPEELLGDAGLGDCIDPARAWQVMMANEKPGGHGERSVAVGVLDMALWDLAAKFEDLPLYRLLQSRFVSEPWHRPGLPGGRVLVYAAGGYYDNEKGIEGLKAEMQGYLDRGYTTVKMKIGGASLSEDAERIEAVLRLLPTAEHLAVDANGRFDRETALAYSNVLAQYGLKWYEEPGDPLDYALNAEVCSDSVTPVATGENLFSHQDVRNLLRFGGMRPGRDYLQMDPALSYGITEYVRMMRELHSLGWGVDRCIPHGGHQFGLQAAAGFGLYGNESYPDVFFPIGGFADGIEVEDGYVRNPDVPGIGIEHKAPLYREFRKLLPDA